ncbi:MULTISPECIES: septation protein A [Neisseria]|uniref:Inner membrane-spanning protein YciB n=1 Tax=Neisseria musculi TaxID=1815583 RepID=A0A7H1MCC5_9NEIS|nr:MULTISPECIES: septation protein A [Neisseria]MBF0802808.1 septation protein A [Neisseria sp. 19428wB4_WF04]QNT59290.1 intracellular septation protein A [Neisseria musculi]TFU44602.1 septation protein A [Neisseria sp. WF04]
MKILSDLIAVVLFFAVYTLTKNIVWATAAAVVAGVLQAGVVWLKYKKLDTMQWVGLVLIVVFGGATILLRDPRFIMWKPTVLFWAGALVLGLGELLGKNGLKAVMGKELQLDGRIWRKLAWIWVVFLVFMGIANIAVAYMFTEAQWVNYKLFGSTGLMVFFVIGQGVYLSRHLSRED